MRIAVTIVLVGMVGISQAQQAARYSERENFGFKALVKGVRTATRILAPDPRKNGKLHIITSSPWIEFDARGFIVEQANSLNADGTAFSLSRILRDADGKPRGGFTVTPNGEVQPDGYTQTRMGAHGPVEEKYFHAGKLMNRTETEYDQHGRTIESRTYGPDGRLANRANWRYDEHGRHVEWRVASHEQLHLHIRYRYSKPDRGDARDIFAKEWLDPSGNIIRSAAFHRGRLTSFWQDPACACEGDIGFHTADKTTTYYFQKDGSLLTAVQSHQERGGSINYDEGVVTDEQDNVVEKLTFSYEYDPFGNWTSRRVAALDPQTGLMVEIQLDTRVLTYY